MSFTPSRVILVTSILITPVIVQAAIFQWIDAIRVVGKTKILGIKAIGIGNDLTAFFSVLRLAFRVSGIHGHQYIVSAAGSKYMIAGKRSW